jgi:AcrR family transcriptional regulator
MAAAQHYSSPESADAIRQKIMDAAGEIFAEQGFQAATVRDICARAGVNVAAINYYFGDKEKLYVDVLRSSTCVAHAEIRRALDEPGRSPEEALRDVIAGICRRMLPKERPSWAFRLMAHEMSRPTPALDIVVNEVIAPSYQRLRDTVGEMLGLPSEHETTRLCTHSIMSQVIHYVTGRPVISRLWPEMEMTAEQVEKIANHIATFSISSIKEMARQADSNHAH